MTVNTIRITLELKNSHIIHNMINKNNVRFFKVLSYAP